ncbi:DNRLRE domain-containing protein [Bacillus testis]|uniref:DNRLRE domain-containing protein n=1 Tax=Bacillus testis TaxID=1622072 RepID=UPI00067F373A|nr:DNRLRE domain-containing protein [Bacillus testis]
MNKNNIRKYLIYVIVFALTLTYIPFNNFVVRAAESNDGKSTKELKRTEELPDKRTENSKTFLNSDGSYTTKISQTPIHFKDQKGAWKEISNELIETQDKKEYTNKANDFSVNFRKEFAKGDQTVSLEDGDKSINFGLESSNSDSLTAKSRSVVKPILGIVDGDSITYPSAMKNADVRYSVGTDRIKEDIVFNEKPSTDFPDKFTYKMNLNGLEVQKEEDTIYLVDPNTNEKLYYFDAPFMYDSFKPNGYTSTDEIKSIPEEALSYDVNLDYELKGEELIIEVIPNKEWLNSPERVYPLTIDPTIVRLQSTPFAEDTNIRSGFPTQTGGDDLELGAGTSGGNVIRSLVKFDLSSIPVASEILSSSLNLWFSSSNNIAETTVSMYKMKADWEENQASWTYGKTQTPWVNKGGDYVTSNKLGSVTLGIPGNIDENMKKWNLPTNIVQDWLLNPSNNYGVMLKSDTENVNYYKKFVSSEQSIAAKYKPLLTITYKTNARLGLENYWSYDSHPLVDGSSYTNLTTSNNVVQYDDLSLLGRAGFGFTFSRTYNSKSRESSALGYGWTFTGNQKLLLNVKQTANIINYQDEDGTDHEFLYDESTATYYAPAGRYEKIKKTSADMYTMYDKNGLQTIFKIRGVSSDTDVKVAYIDSEIDRNNNKINYRYNSQNQLVEISTDLGESLNKVLDIRYNSQGLISNINYDGKQFVYRYENGFLEYVDELKEEGGTNTTTQFVYKNEILDTIIDPKGRKTSYTYQNGNITKVQEPQQDKSTDDTDRPGTFYTLDIPNKVATVTDPENNTTTYWVNDNFVKIKESDYLGKITSYQLDENYNVLSEKETEESKIITVQTNTYDSNGNLTSTKDAEQNTETYQYTTFSNILSHTDSTQKESTYEYYANGNLKTSIVPNNSDFLTTNFEYDSYGDVKTKSSSDGIKETYNTDYSNSIRTTQHKDPNDIVTEFKTDLSGNLLSNKDGKEQETNYHYNLKNELDNVKDAKQKDTKYTYDKNGNLETITNAQKAVTKFEYNGQNLISKEINPLNKMVSYRYDENGNTTTIAKADGKSLHYAFDTNNRLEGVFSGTTQLWKYKYDENDLVITGENDKFLKQISYYDNGLLKSVKYDGVNGNTTFTYKGDQYISGVEYPGYNGFAEIEYIPDNSYKTSTIKRNGTTLVSLGYDKSGMPAVTTFANGSSLNKSYVNGRLDTEILQSKSNITFDTFKYDYDKNNNITSKTTNKGKILYEYDSLDQLTKETLLDGTQVTYAYDNVGNRTSKQIIKNGQNTTIISKYNADNQLEQVGDKD